MVLLTPQVLTGSQATSCHRHVAWLERGGDVLQNLPEPLNRKVGHAALGFLGSLHAIDGSYDNLHLEVFAPDAVVVTRNDHLSWTDTTGTTGEWHSAWTGVFRRIDDEWKIVYAHESTPHEPM